MKKITKILTIIFVICLAFTCVYTEVYADIPTTMPSGSGSIRSIDNTANKIWGTVLIIVQILAFAAIVFAGLRYMFASAEQKADIKKSMGTLALGALLVFAASTLVNWLLSVANEAAG